jgi:hypothetical protein
MSFEKKLALKFLEQIVSVALLSKIVKIRAIGADAGLLNKCLKAAEWPHTIEEIIAKLTAPGSKKISSHLEPAAQNLIRQVVDE